MKSLSILLFALSFVVSTANSAVRNKVRLKVSDIKKIHINNAAKNLLVVQDNNGRILRLNVSPAKRKAIVNAVEGYQVASAVPVPAPRNRTLLQANTSTAKLEETTETKSKWSFHYFLFGSTGAEDLANLEGALTFYNEIGIKYQITDNWKLELRPNANIDYNIEPGNTKHTLGNFIVALNRGTFANLLGFDLSGYVRYYAPTGEAFRKSETKGLFRGNIKATRKLNSALDFGYTTSLRYYMQGNRSLSEFDEYGRLLATPKALRSWRIINEASLTLSLTDKLSLTQTAGIDHGLQYDDPELGLDEPGGITTFDISSSINVSYLSPLDLSLSIAQSHDISANKTDQEGYSPYRLSETQYWLSAFVPF